MLINRTNKETDAQQAFQAAAEIGIPIINCGPGGKANAQLVVYYVPGATLVLDKRTDTTVDLVIGTHGRRGISRLVMGSDAEGVVRGTKVVYKVGEDRGVPFIAMPLLKGEPLEERLRRDR